MQTIHRTTETTGWHHSERVIVQAISCGMALVRYPARQMIGSQPMHDPDTGESFRRGAVQPWAWVPVDDIDIGG